MSSVVELGFPARCSGESFDALLERFRKERRAPTNSTFEQRLSALDGLGQTLVERRGDLPPALSAAGVAFLAGFLQAGHLRELVRREIPDPAALDRFVPAGDRRSLRLLPRGIVCQWIAGNVPLLGMFSWALSALVGNRNVLRLSSRQDDLMSPLFEVLAEISPAGRQMAEQTLICFFDRDQRSIHEQMSRTADVRIAWGGVDAVDAVRSLPSRWDCEDIVMGPRVSLAVIDPEAVAGNLLTRLATDIVYFDQSACSSPQVVFIKGSPGDSKFDEASRALADAIAVQTRRFARHPLDFGETFRIELDRARVLLKGGTLERDEQTRWTVAVVERPMDEVRCTNCFVQVVPFVEFQEVLEAIPENVQTIVTALNPGDFSRFTEEACFRGTCRFPSPGTGNHFDDPWDGTPLVSRLTRWVTRTDPSH